MGGQERRLGEGMQRKKSRKRSTSAATILTKRIALPGNCVLVATPTGVRNYRGSLRLLPRQVYEAIVTAIWETMPATGSMRTDLVGQTR